MKKTLIFLVIILVLQPFQSKAVFEKTHPNLSVGYLLDKCDDSLKKPEEQKKIDSAYCYGYFFAINYALKDYTDTIICLPKNFKHIDEIKTFVKWAKDHPEKQETDQFTGIIYSLGQAYPCDKK